MQISVILLVNILWEKEKAYPAYCKMALIHQQVQLNKNLGKINAEKST